MKAIIFDIDDTLIKWKKEFINALKSVLKDMGYDFPEELIKKIDKAIDNHERYYDKLTKENLLSFINKECQLELPLEFVDKLIMAQSNCVYEDRELITLIEYLSQKYDLYAVSNWFTKTQKKRLEKMQILKYFKNVYGADENYFKPHLKTFDVILKNYIASNCISIGDSLENDVLLPISLGMRAIWLDKKNVGSNAATYDVIKNIQELKNIL